jgi:pilus biogenesis lipoprotein CpaD
MVLFFSVKIQVNLLMKNFLLNVQYRISIVVYTTLLTIGLVGCAGMAPKAQIKVSLQEIEWRGENKQFNKSAKTQITHWLKQFPLGDIRLKLNKSESYYSELEMYLIEQGLRPQQLEVFSPEVKLPTKNIFIAGIFIKRNIPQCPSWSTPNMADSKVSQSSNFGCASERNLAIMIADPSDLIRGKKLHPASAEHSLNALDRYYRRETTQVEAEAPAEPLIPPVIDVQ